jgi:hypothetical protein
MVRIEITMRSKRGYVMNSYKISNNKKILSIGKQQISFEDDIENILAFSNIFAVLLGNTVSVKIEGKPMLTVRHPANNIYIINYECNILWTINQIITVTPPVFEADKHYVRIHKISENLLRVWSQNSIAYDIDINTFKVVNRVFTK